MTRHGVVYRRTAGLAVLVVSLLAVSAGVAAAGVAITINAPKGTYEVGQSVTVDYSCTSEFTIFQCDLSDGGGLLVPGTPVDTSSPGEFFVGVAVADSEPSDGVFVYSYNVVAAQPPTVTLTTPANGARFSALRTLFRPVRVSFSCADAESGIKSCTGTQRNGAKLKTGFQDLGRHTFVVTARDNAGHTTRVTHTYTVVPY